MGIFKIHSGMSNPFWCCYEGEHNAARRHIFRRMTPQEAFAKEAEEGVAMRVTWGTSVATGSSSTDCEGGWGELNLCRPLTEISIALTL